MEENKAKIREFLLRFIFYPDLMDHEDIFASGYVNSLFAMQLVMFVEKEFGIWVERQDLKLDNFRSVNALANLIDRKSAPQTRA
jgi:acyl carrier protein